MRSETMRSWGFPGLSVLALLGCENEDAAQRKCEQLAQKFCEKVVSCAQGGMPAPSSEDAAMLYADCETEVRHGARCDQVVRITPSYDECLTDSQNLDCAAVQPALAMSQLPLPKSCEAFVVYSDN